MKNLKKLSVVLFATLLSFNFTSCIDDGVSDAVDQVYLAQAQFLLAQAALQEAEAQFALAAAAHEQAEAALTLAYAEVQLAVARELDANTAWHMAEIDRYAAQTEFLNQQNVMTLAKWQAEMDVYLQEQMTLLLAAQTAHEVAMVNLGEAVAQAKDLLIFDYYMDYGVVVTELQDLYEDKIMAEHDLALKELMLVGLADGNPATTTDQVSMAYYQAKLETELANLIADLEAEQAWLATLEAITPEDATDYQKAVSAIDEEIAALDAQWEALVIEKAEKFNARDQAFEAWQASMAHYQELVDAIGLHAAAVAAKKVHTDMIADTEDAIAEAEANIAGKPALLAAIEAVDTTTAYNAVQAAIAAVEAAYDALGTDQTTGSKEPEVGDAPKVVETAWDAVWNAKLAYLEAQDALDCAETNWAFGWGPWRVVQNLEWRLTIMEEALADWNVGFPYTLAEIEAMVLAANTEEELATAAWQADPDGGLHEDEPYDPTADAGDYIDDLDQLGIPEDGEDYTFMQVIGWSPIFFGSDDYYPTAVAPTKYTLSEVEDYFDVVEDEDGELISAAGLPYTGTISPTGEWRVDDINDDFRLWYQDGDNHDGENNYVMTAPDGSRDFNFTVSNTVSTVAEPDINRVYFLEVEEDDTYLSNLERMDEARNEAAYWQYVLNLYNDGEEQALEDRDEALEDVQAAYLCLGYVWGDATYGTINYSDFFAITEYIEGLEEARDDAYKAWNNSGTSYDAYTGFMGANANTYSAGDKASSLGLVWNAEKAVLAAEAALGTDFRTPWTGNSWTTHFGEWYALASTTVVPAYTSSTIYEPLREQVGPDGSYPGGDWVRDYTLPHVAVGSGTITAYQALRNAYFERVWAIEAYEACLYVTYDSYNDNDPVNYDWTASNEDVIEQGALDIAALEALMPTHDYAIEYLLSEVERLMDIFDFDFTLWDFEVDHGLAMLGDLELYAAYLDAMNAYDWILHQFDIVDGQIADLEFLRFAYTYLQPGTGFGSAESVSGFMGLISDAISGTGGALETIAGLEDSIEIQTQLVAHGIIDTDTAQAWIDECQRQLDLLNIEIEGFEAAAASLLDRINALLAG